MSRELAGAITKADAGELYGRLKPGERFQHGVLSNTLATIANISEKGRLHVKDN